MALNTESMADMPRPCFLSCANRYSLWLQVATTDSTCCEKFKSCLVGHNLILQCVRKKWDQNVFCMTLGLFRWNFIDSFLNKFTAKSCTIHVYNLASVMFVHYPVKLKSARMYYHWVIIERNSRIYSTLAVTFKFARFASSWLESVGNITREGVQNTHNWSGRTETATENGVGQARSRHCGSHLSVTHSIAPDQRCVFCTRCLAIFPHIIINCIQSWRIRRLWDRFWS